MPIPPLFDSQEKGVQRWLETPGMLNLSDAGCVDADTEYFTGYSWKKFKDYTPGDKVLQYDPDTDEAELVQAEFVKKPCNLMLHFKNARGVDQMLSPEHRVLAYHEKTKKPYVLTAEEMKAQHETLVKGFRGRFKNTFTLANGTPTLKTEQIRVQAMLMADGHFHVDVENWCRVRIKKNSKVNRAELLLTNAKIPFRTSELKEGYVDFRFKAPIKTKTPTTEMWGWDSQSKEVFLEESKHWDSCSRKNNSFSFSTTVRENADFIQICAVANARTTSLRSCERPDKGHTEHVVHVQDKETLRGLKTTTKTEIEEVAPDDGFKYCFTVPSSFFIARRNGYIFATGNTGKTRTSLETIVRRNTGMRTLVLAPLSILKPAWGDDIDKWTPSLSYSIAYAKNREQAFRTRSDIVITNHDAVKWLAERPELLEDFDTIIVDEFTAFKNPTSKRTKALLGLRQFFDFIYMLSGTPNPQSVIDLWAPTYFVDGGERLGRLFYAFRNQVCFSVQVGKDARAVQWKDKNDALDKVMVGIDDIVYRVPLEGLPENREYTIHTDLPPKLMKQYKELEKKSILELESGGMINAIHAGARIKKMLQLLTGAVYDETGEAQLVHTERYELVMQLVEERKQSVVAFNWRHERQNLVKLAEKMGITYGIIDGEIPVGQREQIVEDFQAGKIRVIFAHPQSAGHGLTLTAGQATIWCSPTYNSEHYSQFNRRIYRTGQTKRTETIRVAARGTCEHAVFEKLDGKIEKMSDLLVAALNFSKAS